MRKLCRVFFCVGIFILLLQFASALNINLDESYERSETVIAKIDGSVLNTISLSKMKVLRKGYIYSAVDKGIQRLGDDYYLWFNAPNLADDYTLVLEDVSTIVGGIPKVIDYAVDFSVSAIKTDYSIKPGFIYAYNDFEVEIVLYEDYSKSIDLSFPTSRSVVLRSGSNDVDFDVGNVVGVQLVEISIGKYNFPAYIIGSEPIEPIMSVCGNNIIEDGEICECGIDMTFGNWDDLIEDETCQTLGYDDGELSCLSDCSGINISACVNDEEPTEFVCGNNIIEDGEICECGIDGICGNVDDKLNLTTCDDFGFDSGNLSCSICAEFNVEACFNISEENVTNVTQVVNITNVTQSGNISFKISPQYIKVTELINSEDLGYVFSIFNNGNVSIENILFYYDRELFLIAPEGNVSIAPNSSLEFSVAVLENNESIIEGTFYIESEDLKKDFFLEIDFTENSSQTSVEYYDLESNTEKNLYYCSDIVSGIKCVADETCDGTVAESLDGECCLGKCVEENGSGGIGTKWIGYFLVALVILIVIVVGVKYKKAGTKKVNPLQRRVSEVQGKRF